MKLKSLIAASLICGTLTTSLFGSGLFTPAKEGHISINSGLNSNNSQSNSTVNIGVGYDSNYETFMLGTNMYYDLPIDSTVPQYFTLELTAGYRATPKTTIYGLVAYDYSFNYTADGVGGGVGLKYQLMNHIAIDTRVKYTSMDPVIGKAYNKVAATIGIEFNYRKADGSYQLFR